ncbi:MAG: ABC transporter substrate-binding protein [Oscillospiraceae bacterium]|nr:ABC transporter substrate-binding protein [Oscillospiraceae bacterium]
MKKVGKILALLLVCVMIVSIAACNKTDNNNNNNATNADGSNNSTTSNDNSNTQNSNSNNDNSSNSNSNSSNTNQNTDNSQQSGGRDTLTVAIPADTGSLDPAVAMSNLTPTTCVMQGMWDQKFNGDLIFLLATDIEYITPDHWIIPLREGVKFNNGNDFTASDILFSLNIYRNSGINATKAQVIDLDRTVALDDYTIDLYWDYWRTNQWGILSDMLVYDEESYDPEIAGSRPIGTGPFVVTEYVVNSHINLERRDDYWGEQPAMKYINFKVMSETSQVLNAIETKELDVGLLARSDVEYASSLPGVYTEARYEGNWTTIVFNIWEDSVFYHNPEARYAVCYAIDTQAIINLVYLGQASVMHSPITTTCLDYEDRFNDRHDTYATGYDVAKAKQLADSNGLTGKDLVIITNGLADQVTVAELLQNMLKDIGVSSSINNYDMAGYNAARDDPHGGWDIAIASAINPGNRVAGTLVNGIRFYPNMQLPGLFTELDRFLELMMPAFMEADDQERSNIYYELFGLYGQACFSFALCDIENTYAYADDIDYDSVIYRLHGLVRYCDVKFK